MEYKSVKGYSGWAQLGFLFVFLGLGFILAGGIQFLLTKQILPAGTTLTDGDAAMKALLAPENVTMARVIQVASTFLLLFVPAVLWSFISNGNSFFWLGFNKYVNVFQIMLGFMIIFTAGFTAGPLEDISKSIVKHFPTLDALAKNMEDLYMQQALALSNLKSLPEYLVALVIMAFFPAMFEEVFFRGAVQNYLVKWWQKPMLAILVTSVLFSIIHMSVYLFMSRMVLGFVLGLMFYKTKNIWVNIVAHFINNALALTAMYAMRNLPGKKNLDVLEPDMHWSVMIIGIFVLAGLFLFLNKYSVKNVAKTDARENLMLAAADPYSSVT